jgi:hypothetical protein
MCPFIITLQRLFMNKYARFLIFALLFTNIYTFTSEKSKRAPSPQQVVWNTHLLGGNSLISYLLSNELRGTRRQRLHFSATELFIMNDSKEGYKKLGCLKEYRLGQHPRENYDYIEQFIEERKIVHCPGAISNFNLKTGRTYRRDAFILNTNNVNDCKLLQERFEEARRQQSLELYEKITITHD